MTLWPIETRSPQWPMHFNYGRYDTIMIIHLYLQLQLEEVLQEIC